MAIKKYWIFRLAMRENAYTQGNTYLGTHRLILIRDLHKLSLTLALIMMEL